MLTREEILHANDKKYVDVDVPEWGGSVRICSMSAKDRLLFQQASLSRDNKVADDFVERLLVLCITDENNKRIFDLSDVAALAEKNSAVIVRLFNIAAELNALTERSVEKIKGE